MFLFNIFSLFTISLSNSSSNSLIPSSLASSIPFISNLDEDICKNNDYQGTKNIVDSISSLFLIIGSLKVSTIVV